MCVCAILHALLSPSFQLYFECKCAIQCKIIMNNNKKRNVIERERENKRK